MIDVSRVTAKGQITIPVEFRRKFNIKEGDKVVFMEKDGMIVIANSNRMAFEEFQQAMKGEAEMAGITNEEDVVKLCREVRSDLVESNHASNA
jgi:AbrB family looped-hinge helix DNA binding protein